MIALHQAILSLGYFGLMCVGEMGASEHCLKVKDVHIVQNKRKLMIILHTSKTHWQDNKPQVIKISSARKEEHKSKLNYHFCPYNILRTFVQCRRSFKDEQEQFFVFQNRMPVSTDHIRKILQRLIAELKLDPSLYNVHSLRSGRSLDLLDSGLSKKLEGGGATQSITI